MTRHTFPGSQALCTPANCPSPPSLRPVAFWRMSVIWDEPSFRSLSQRLITDVAAVVWSSWVKGSFYWGISIRSADRVVNWRQRKVFRRLWTEMVTSKMLMVSVVVLVLLIAPVHRCQPVPNWIRRESSELSFSVRSLFKLSAKTYILYTVPYDCSQGYMGCRICRYQATVLDLTGIKYRLLVPVSFLYHFVV